MSKKVIIYTYYQTDVSNYNLSFFLKNEVRDRDNIDYIFVINGYSCSIEELIPKLTNVTIIKRENKGFDFGGHHAALNYLKEIEKTYDYYIFLNSGVFGPVLKKGLCENNHWSNIFTSKIVDKVKLVATSIVCLPHHDLGGFGPKVESFFFVTDKLGLDLFIEEGTIFCNHIDKVSAIVNGEYGLSRCIFKHNYTIDCMLDKYRNIDWYDKKNWYLNNNKHPTRKGSYFGKTIDPYDVIFHKWYWAGQEKVNFDIIKKYVSETVNNKEKDLLVLFVFHEYNNRVKRFIENSIFKDDNIDFLLICNNKNLNFDVPSHVEVIKRENIGFDFGGWSEGILVNNRYKQYKNFIFANSSIIGPFNKNGKWTDIYLNGLKKYELFGSTINTCNINSEIAFVVDQIGKDSGAIKHKRDELAHVQSYIFSLNKKTLQLLIDNEIFSLTSHARNFNQAITNKEIYMSRVIINNNYRIGSLLKIYDQFDFRDKKKLQNLPIMGDTMYLCHMNKLWTKEDLVFIKGNRMKIHI